jgi:hypothetical protein
MLILVQNNSPNSCSPMVSKMLFNSTSTSLLKFVQMLQPRQHNLFTRLFNLSRQEHFIQNSVNLSPTPQCQQLSLFPSIPLSITLALSYLVKVEHQIQFTHVPKELIQHFDEEMYGFQVC